MANAEGYGFVRNIPSTAIQSSRLTRPLVVGGLDDLFRASYHLVAAITNLLRSPRALANAFFFVAE